MPSIIEDTKAPAKVLLYGRSGVGKTGAQASLVAAGYNLRIIDTDKGIRPLRSLLTDPHYPYAAIIKKRGIDLDKAVRYIPIDTTMRYRVVEKKSTSPSGQVHIERTPMLAPEHAKAWGQALTLLDEWKDGDVNFGPIMSWGPDSVLVLDSFSTLAMGAYYFNQSINGRLGAREEGFESRRDMGGAQTQLRRALELIYDSKVMCNVVVISHIVYVDESQGVASVPRTTTEDGKNILASAPEGFPSAVGRALSPNIGKYFNDMYVVTASGSGDNVTRTIRTVPQGNLMAKNSVHLNREYPVTWGLASIFASIRGQPQPQDLIDAYAKPITAIPQKPTTAA